MHVLFLGRDGLTHNMLNDIHNHWKHDEAVRIKCMGVPTVDMKNVCTQLEVVHFLTKFCFPLLVSISYSHFTIPIIVYIYYG